MISNVIEIGTKVDIYAVAEKERSARTGETVTVYKSQVYDIFEDEQLELLMPTEGGKLLLLSLGLRYEFVFYTKSGLYRAIGYVKERYKTDNRYLVRVELHTPLSKFQRRQFYRLKCIIDMRYCSITKEQASYGRMEDLMDELRQENYYERLEAAQIVDISGGGVRFMSEQENRENDYVLMRLSLDDGREEKKYDLIGHVVGCSQAENSRRDHIKYESRVEFIWKDTKIQEEIIRYIFEKERKSRKSGKE